MVVRDFTKIYKGYKGKWVALSSDKKTVVSSGKTAKNAYKNAQEKGEKSPVMFKVPTSLRPYIGYCIK